MTAHAHAHHTHSPVLVMAVEGSTIDPSVGSELARLMTSDGGSAARTRPGELPLLVIAGTSTGVAGSTPGSSAIGQALRHIYRIQPRVVLVCVTPEHLDESASLIETVRQRRPEIRLLAVSLEHSEQVERAVRIAGAQQYLLLCDERDRRALRETLEALHIGPAPPPDTDAGALGPRPRPPPRSRRRPRWGRGIRA